MHKTKIPNMAPYESLLNVDSQEEILRRVQRNLNRLAADKDELAALLEDTRREYTDAAQRLCSMADCPDRERITLQLATIKTVLDKNTERFEEVSVEFEDFRQDALSLLTPDLRWVDFWQLFRFILPRKTQIELYEPLYNEFLEDFLIARRYKSKAAQRWLRLCFACRTVSMVVGCFWVMCGSKLRRVLLAFLPEALRRFWSS